MLKFYQVILSLYKIDDCFFVLKTVLLIAIRKRGVNSGHSGSQGRMTKATGKSMF